MRPENIKKCPVCGKFLKNYKNGKACSKKCFNSTFKQLGEKHWNYKGGSKTTYRRYCFENHERKCVVCDEKIFLEAHHMDKNIENNKPDNLIPLCLNHHKYIHHKKYKYLIEDIILKYINDFKSKNQ